MARLGVQYEEVVEAVNAIQQQGENPTIARIRDYLGTGSFTTLSQHLRQFRQEQRQKTPLKQAGHQVPSNLTQLSQNLWQAAIKEADDKLAAYQAQADARVEKAQEEIAQILKSAEKVTEQNSLLEKQNQELLAEVKKLTAELATSQALAKEEASQAAARLNKLSQQQESSQAKINQLEEELTGARSEYLAEINQKEALMQANLASFNENLTQANQQLNLAHQQLADKTNQLSQAEQSLAQTKQLAASQLEELAAKSQQQKQLESQLSLAKEQQAAANADFHNQLLKLKEETLLHQQAQNEQLNTKFAQLEHKLANFELPNWFFSN